MLSEFFEERRYLIPFRATLLPQIFTDVLVIGTGVAGMSAAVESANGGGHTDVILTCKGAWDRTSTAWAQGGISAVLGGEDSVEAHVEDTLHAGGDLCDAGVAREIVAESAAQIERLARLGMALDREPGGGYQLGREGGHRRARIVHAHGDATGKALAATLHEQVEKSPSIRLFDQCFVLDLITREGAPSSCLGAITYHPKFGLQVIWAHTTVLSTGGCGQVFRESTNPEVATGDGLAMAYRAGAAMADLAFIQFHPTTLYIAGATRSLITEAVRGEGARLIDRTGHRFMADYDERGELAPRDVVSRSIVAQMAKTGHTNVYLDVRHFEAGRFAERFPGIDRRLREFGIDPTEQPIPIQPAAHYMVGGVLADTHGRTNVTDLLCVGEASATGFHGANRLASNSLLEGLVCGARAGVLARERAAEVAGHTPMKVISDIRPSDRSELDLPDVRSSLRSVMWRHVGIERDGKRLDEVEGMIDFWARYTMDKIFDDVAGWEVQNMLTAGGMITRAAQWREESRGTHYRLDHPEPVEAFRVRDVWQRGKAEPERLGVSDDVVVSDG
ncbi:L-aspartate oxidase [Mucisphaera sp.]|uniref:L-aspartate oxidase n=1 Tax=Mucisphaera sp. TaxID=2913024 RepID=UPI003D12EA54